MKYTGWVTTAALLLLSTATTSCFNSSDVKIGVIIPQEGSLAEYGYQIRSGIQMAYAEIQAQQQSGELKLRKNYQLIWENEDENNIEGIQASFNNLKEKGVAAIIGPASSAGVLALADMANKSHIVLLSPSASSPENNTEAGDYVFRNYPSDTLEAQQLSNVVFQKCKMQRILMVRARNTFSEGITYEMLRFGRQNSKAIPGEVIKFDPDPKNVDFVQVVDRIVKESPEGIFMAAYTDELIELLREINTRKELKELNGGQGLYMFTCSAFVPVDVIEALGKEAVEGLMFTAYNWDPHDPSNERIQAFSQKFQKDYHTMPGIFAGTGYDAVYILLQAIDSVNHNVTDEVRDQMLKATFKDGIVGETDFNKSGNITRIPQIFIMEEGVAMPLSDERIEVIRRNVLTSF
jgi:branched-chain amino acid transport system substrate-binding protein